MLLVMPEVYDTAKEFNDSLERTAILSIPFWFQLVHAYMGSVVMMTAGIFILRGHNWARITLLIWILSVLIITFLIVGFTFHLYSKFLIAVIIFFLLYRQNSNSYFSKGYSKNT